MYQTSLSRYFHFPSQPPSTGPSFLDLPYHLRHRVYVLAGLVRTTCAIDFNRETQDRAYNHDAREACARPKWCRYPAAPSSDPFEKWHENEIDCVCPRLPVALLYVSRIVSRECVRILYSENKFKICRNRHRGLLPLHGLRGDTMACLASLTIRLNRCPCRPFFKEGLALRPSDYHVDCKNGFARNGDNPLSGISRNDKYVLSDWRNVCAKLAANIRPLQLRLFVICDTANHEIASKVVEPLSNFPTLLACSIRLGQMPNDRLRSLAETAVRRLTAQPLPVAPDEQKPPIQLPLEILRRILYFTDLIAPRHLLWEDSHGLQPYRCNGHCTDGHEACCCSTHHAAFSSSPCTTTCWKLPRNLFLVNHSLRSEAERIFYRHNHFVLLPPDAHVSFFRAQRNSPPSLHAFLSAIPTHCVRHLRSLEVLFSNIDDGFFMPGGPDATSPAWWWTRGVQLLLSHCETLALTLNLSSQRVHAAETAGVSAPQMDTTEVLMRSVYRRVLEPLVDPHLQAQAHMMPTDQGERSLRDLFVYLSWPLALDERRKRNRAEHEIVLERLVMGAGYDATTRGKVEMGPWGGLTNIEW